MLTAQEEDAVAVTANSATQETTLGYEQVTQTGRQILKNV